jgi:hypothetical protein
VLTVGGIGIVGTGVDVVVVVVVGAPVVVVVVVVVMIVGSGHISSQNIPMHKEIY